MTAPELPPFRDRHADYEACDGEEYERSRAEAYRARLIELIKACEREDHTDDEDSSCEICLMLAAIGDVP